ncbi:MAG: TPM domain-containing protein [Verrucomicrobiota bacterium]
MKILNFIIVCALLFSVTACSDKKDPSKVIAPGLQVKLPARPSKQPKFFNTSSIQSINEVAIGDLRRAGEYTGIDFAMLLVDELPDQISIEMAAAQLFDEWQVGAENQGKGVLFLFVEKTGALKIEVGYELEDTFPDAFVGSFQETLKDYYRGEYFGDVVSKMVITMMRRAQGEEAKVLMDSFVDGLPRQQDVIVEKSMRYRSGGAGVTESNFITNKEKKLKNVQQLSDEERAQYDKGVDLEIVLQRYIKSLQAGVNDPYLPLLTEGSQMMRLEYPKNAGFQRRAFSDFSGKYKIHQKGDFAAIRFERADVMPILFRKDSKGDWLADITKSWAYSQASRDLKKMNPAFGDHAWMFAWENELHKPEEIATPAPLPKEKTLSVEIARLEKAIKNEPKKAANYFALADLLYFECYWIRDAMELIEKGLVLDPGNNPYRKRFILFAYRFPDWSRVEHHYEQILQHDPGDAAALHRFIYYLKNKDASAYADRIKTLEARKSHLLVPVFPFPVYAKYGEYWDPSFNLASSTRHLRSSYEFVVAHKAGEWNTVANLYLYDEERHKSFGVNILLREIGGELTISPRSSDSKKLKSFTLPADKAIEIEYHWDKPGVFEMVINGRKLMSLHSEMNPSQIRVSQSSGASIISLKEE